MGVLMQVGRVIDRIRRLMDGLSHADQRVVLDSLKVSYFTPMNSTERSQRHRFIHGNASVASDATAALQPPATPALHLTNVVPVVALEASSNGNHGGKKLQDEAIQILTFLNSKTGKNYRTVETNLILVRARLKSGASSDDIRGVIARKVREWKGTEMEKYLRPATLFNATKFEQYIGEQGT